MKSYEQITVIKFGEKFFDGRRIENECFKGVEGTVMYTASVVDDLNGAQHYLGELGKKRAADAVDLMRKMGLKPEIASFWTEIEFTYSGIEPAKKYEKKEPERGELSEAWLLSIDFLREGNDLKNKFYEKEEEADEHIEAARRMEDADPRFCAIKSIKKQKIFIRRS